MWSLGRFAAATALALLALRSAAGLRRSWLRREIRQALGILQRLQERAGQCAATEGREGRRAAKRALAIAGAASGTVTLTVLQRLNTTKGAHTMSWPIHPNWIDPNTWKESEARINKQKPDERRKSPDWGGYR